MTDHTELKRAASAAKNWGGEVGEGRWYAAECFKRPYFSIPDAEFIAACEPGAVLALIAENEQLAKTADCWDRLNVQNKALSDSFRAERDQAEQDYKDVVGTIELRDIEIAKIKAEVAGLRTGYEAYEQVNAELKAECEVAGMRIKEMDLLFGRYILAMRSALIEEEHGKGPAAAMEWIYNSLAGPGELPPEGETDSQAYFDREIVAVDNGMQEVMAFHEGRRVAIGQGEQS
ncbi:hypothetical protein HBO12_16795 [Pseudomonas sp. WS 5059]|uniref:hypothetical protein n=1 Tax=Pseudomonas sp. WS 5059 TaxID=2717491 RepID=UPI00147502EA|nr:hypothetical protein [Pseudomonas sp. WS 5059]NMY04619.1 hypothetical protein [Pseudomonas sp. WS 5059]